MTKKTSKSTRRNPKAAMSDAALAKVVKEAVRCNCKCSRDGSHASDCHASVDSMFMRLIKPALEGALEDNSKASVAVVLSDGDTFSVLHTFVDECDLVQDLTQFIADHRAENHAAPSPAGANPHTVN